MDIKSYIRDVPDFPVPGIVFKDITPVLKEPAALRQVTESFVQRYADGPIDLIVGVEARGFLFAAPLAVRLGKPLIPVRKQGKLPFDTMSVSYALEYGEATVEVHANAFESGQRALIVDDVLATGGTLAACAALVERAGGIVAGFAVLIELTDLSGRRRLGSHDLFVLLHL